MASPDRKTGSYEVRRRARRRVVQALYQWLMTGDSATDIIDQFREEQSWEHVDEAYFELLLREAISENDSITQGLAPCLDRPIEQLDYLERSVLQLASAELQCHPEIPFKVVLDEAIDIARRFGADQSHTYVNAVLDKAAKHWRASETGAGSAADG